MSGAFSETPICFFPLKSPDYRSHSSMCIFTSVAGFISLIPAVTEHHSVAHMRMWWQFAHSCPTWLFLSIPHDREEESDTVFCSGLSLCFYLRNTLVKDLQRCQKTEVILCYKLVSLWGLQCHLWNGTHKSITYLLRSFWVKICTDLRPMLGT